VTPDQPFTTADVARACARLPPPREPLYHFFSVPEEHIKPSSLVVPVIDIDGEAALILTKRASAMRDHAGDWVFPGGRIDEGELPQDGAVREAEEELGIPRSQLTIIGQLDARGPIVTGHIIDVFVAAVAPTATIDADPREVEEVACVPIRALADPAAHHTSRLAPQVYRRARMIEGVTPPPRDLHFFAFGEGEQVWGTQGEIIWDLLACLLGDRPTIADIRQPRTP
jgi:8-oxo-dGTP pyrophosphatase MutT (NUDIX family)